MDSNKFCKVYSRMNIHQRINFKNSLSGIYFKRVHVCYYTTDYLFTNELQLV